MVVVVLNARLCQPQRPATLPAVPGQVKHRPRPPGAIRAPRTRRSGVPPVADIARGRVPYVILPP